MTNGSDLTVVVGALVTMIAGFLAVAKIMLGASVKEREADRQERLKLAEAIGKMAESTEKVAKYTKEGNVQSAERNGHLGELIVQQAEQTKQIADVAVGQILKGVNVQNVGEQKVEHQHVQEVIKE